MSRDWDDQPSITIEGVVHRQTELAVLFSDDDDEDNAVWLPKSQISWDGTEDDPTRVVMPEWLAQKNGLM